MVALVTGLVVLAVAAVPAAVVGDVPAASTSRDAASLDPALFAGAQADTASAAAPRSSARRSMAVVLMFVTGPDVTGA